MLPISAKRITNVTPVALATARKSGNMNAVLASVKRVRYHVRHVDQELVSDRERHPIGIAAISTTSCGGIACRKGPGP